MTHVGTVVDRGSDPGMSPDRIRQLQTSLALILLAALVTGPLYVVAEGMAHLWRVLRINGSTAVVMGVFLLLVGHGYARLVSRMLVWGLLGLISVLSALNGESIHVNVVNFIVVLVLAHVLLDARSVVLVGVTAAVAMTAIAHQQVLVPPAPQGDARLVATVVQFLPQFLLITVLLRLPSRAWRDDRHRAVSASGSVNPGG